MIAIAYGFEAISTQSGFLHGLKLAAVAVVAQAVWTMAVKLCPDRERVTLAIAAACVVLGSSVAWLQAVVLSSPWLHSACCNSGNGRLGCSFFYRGLRVFFFSGSSRGGLIQMVSAKTCQALWTLMESRLPILSLLNLTF
jgi:hypothetical protein